jgi:hypothetical protein
MVWNRSVRMIAGRTVQKRRGRGCCCMSPCSHLRPEPLPSQHALPGPASTPVQVEDQSARQAADQGRHGLSPLSQALLSLAPTRLKDLLRIPGDFSFQPPAVPRPLHPGPACPCYTRQCGLATNAERPHPDPVVAAPSAARSSLSCHRRKPFQDPQDNMAEACCPGPGSRSG